MRRALTPLLGITLYLSVLAASPTQAQYRLDSWTTDSGLPQNYVRDILQTRDGYLWLTTFDGLVRFDGVRFTVFNRANSPGFGSNRLGVLHEDVAGDLWIGTEDGRLIRRHQGRFSTHEIDRTLPARDIEDFDGKAIGIDPTANTSVGRHVSTQLNPGLGCTSSGMKLWCTVDGTTKEWTLTNGSNSSSTLMLVPGSALGKDKSVWVPIANLGLVRIEPEKAPRVYTIGDAIPGAPIALTTGAKLILLSRDAKNAFWLTDLESMRSEVIATQMPDTLLSVLKAYADREGNVWLGTVRDGLVRARPQSIKTYSTAEGLANNNVYPVHQDRHGTVWVGTMEGLFRYENGTFIIAQDLGKRAVTSIAEDSLGQLVVGSFGTLLIREGERFIPKLELPKLIWTIYPQSDGVLWIGCENGLIRYKDNNATYYTTKDGLAGDDIKVIIDDAAGGFWIGSYGGLTHYRDGQFKSWTERDGLPSNFVRSLYQDREGTLWIGTYDGGLARLRDGRLTRYTIDHGLFNNGVFQILEDHRGNFWMSSNRGIYRVSRRELTDFADGKIRSITSVAYGKSDGMLNVECNGGRWPAGAVSRDGKLWFPTQDGVAMVDPDAIPINSQPPPVLIESFLVDRTAVAFDSGVEIRPGQVDFTIQYTALSFLNSDNIRFKYRLEGLDSDWIEVGNRREALFSRVPPGSYTFRVIAANSDGVWNTEGAVVKVVVHPYFYRTWWFLALVALSIFGLGLVIYKVRVNRLELARREQEEFSRKLLASQEQERQRIAAELHDSLGQSLLIIKNRIALAQTDIEEREAVEEQLDELSHSAASAIDECREIAYNLRPYQLERFGLTKTLAGIFMRLNDVTEIKATSEIEPIDDLLARDVETSVYRIVQECVNNIIKHSGASEASLSVSHSEREITLTVQDNGRGFTATETPKTDRSGFGLLGIAERVKMLKGSLQIDSSHGTRVRIQIPINAQGKAA